jgi:transcriptional regulator with XRE-family HTH domain
MYASFEEIMDLAEVGKVVERRRKLLKVNQLDICSVAEISQRTLTTIENGKGNPSIKTLMKIVDTLGMEIQITIKKKNI